MTKDQIYYLVISICLLLGSCAGLYKDLTREKKMNTWYIVVGKADSAQAANKWNELIKNNLKEK